MDQIKPFIRAWEDPLPRATFIVSTSGCTEALETFAEEMNMTIPMHLLDLEQLVKDLNPRLRSLGKACRPTSFYNIKFLPESDPI